MLLNVVKLIVTHVKKNICIIFVCVFVTHKREFYVD